jgi:hypothetical protein
LPRGGLPGLSPIEDNSVTNKRFSLPRLPASIWVKPGQGVTFVATAKLAEHTLFQAGDRFYLGIIDLTLGDRVHIKQVVNFATLEEARAALARAKGRAHWEALGKGRAH